MILRIIVPCPRTFGAVYIFVKLYDNGVFSVECDCILPFQILTREAGGFPVKMITSKPKIKQIVPKAMKNH